MQRYSSLFLVVLVLTVLGAWTPAGADIVYGVGEWPSNNRGSHRALVQVSGAANAVRAHVEWRRRDASPATKRILVFDSTTGQQITNVVAVDVNQVYGEIVFQPQTPQGIYEIYYLPWTLDGASGNAFDVDHFTSFLPPVSTADSAWLNQIGYVDAESFKSHLDSLPSAQLTEIQARTDFDRFDPMEVIATPDEITTLLAQNPNRNYLLFPEDRTRSIRMYETIPQTWVQRTYTEEFNGQAQPGEIYPFQIGVYAARTSVSNLKLKFSSLVCGSTTIPANELHCINLKGNDYLGQSLTKVFNVSKGDVRALWCWVEFPKTTSGLYQGTVEVSADGAETRTMAININVTGTVLEDGGLVDPWRLGKLKWLDSTLGIDRIVPTPYTAVGLSGSTVNIRNHTISVDKYGLPASMKSDGVEVLAAPIAFTVSESNCAMRFNAVSSRVLSKFEDSVSKEYVSQSTDGRVGLTTRWSMEYDGCIDYEFTVAALQSSVSLSDVGMVVPVRETVGKYMIGMRRMGGFSPDAWSWQWNVDKVDNYAWIGDGNAGLYFKLMHETNNAPYDSFREFGYPVYWYNGGLGGCQFSKTSQAVLARAFSGSRTIQPGAPAVYKVRFYVTPVRPLDVPNSWSQRYGISGLIQHIHHATSSNPYINYPFLTIPELKAINDSWMADAPGDLGTLTYPAYGNILANTGSLNVWTTINFDPAVGVPLDGASNKDFWRLAFADGSQMGLYWNFDAQALRVWVKEGAAFPFTMNAPTPTWAKGQKHLISLSWGSEISVYIDGHRVAGSAYTGLTTKSLVGCNLMFYGSGFIVEGIKISNTRSFEGVIPTPTVSGSTLLCDTFANWDGPDKTIPTKCAAGTFGQFSGLFDKVSGQFGTAISFSSRMLPSTHLGTNVYYTIRELTNQLPELWALRSLGSEVSASTTIIYNDQFSEIRTAGASPGGHHWLREHLVEGYVPGWVTQFSETDVDAAIGTNGNSRWNNFYVEGMQYLMQQTGIDGLYLDGIGYDRDTMKRIYKVMNRTNPKCRINFHGGNCNHDSVTDGWGHVLPMHIEHLPYLTNCWLGESFNYDQGPDYWFVEVSGLPFGQTSEMLNNDNGGNAYRGMLYAMGGRQLPCSIALWNFWESYAIQDTEMIGYWDQYCPVKTNRSDVLATVYKKKGETLISIGSWATSTVNVSLDINWSSLGINPATATITAPSIDGFQSATTFQTTAPIPVEAGKGWLLIVR